MGFTVDMFTLTSKNTYEYLLIFIKKAPQIEEPNYI